MIDYALGITAKSDLLTRVEVTMNHSFFQVIHSFLEENCSEDSLVFLSIHAKILCDEIMIIHAKLTFLQTFKPGQEYLLNKIVNNITLSEMTSYSTTGGRLYLEMD